MLDMLMHQVLGDINRLQSTKETFGYRMKYKYYICLIYPYIRYCGTSAGLRVLNRPWGTE
jgi:hypothetical protein